MVITGCDMPPGRLPSPLGDEPENRAGSGQHVYLAVCVRTEGHHLSGIAHLVGPVRHLGGWIVDREASEVAAAVVREQIVAG